MRPPEFFAHWSHIHRGDFAVGQRLDYTSVRYGSFATGMRAGDR